MLRRKKQPGRSGGPWALIAALALAGAVLLAALAVSCGAGRSPRYLPHGDVIFMPRG